MEFDKSKVYTALNADELQIGSKCIFAHSLKDLKDRIYLTDTYGHILEDVLGENEEERFYGNNATYLLAYLIEPPKKPEYKPFSSTEKAMEAIKKHGEWVKKKATGDLKLINSINGAYRLYSIGTGGAYCTPEAFLECYIFADDGTPCGELVEE